MTQENVAVDPVDAQRFLELLGGAGPFGFRTFDDAKDEKFERGEEPDPRLTLKLFGTFDAHAAELARYNDRGAGAFVSINALDGRGHSTENVKRVRAFVADLDDPATARATLDRARAGKLPPSIVVESSPDRFHLYWLPADEPALEDFSDVCRGLIARFESDPRVKDLARVMRLPGFVHRKKTAAPFRSRIVEASGARYAVADLKREFPAPVPEPARPRSAPARARSFDRARVESALAAIPAVDRDDYTMVIRTVKLSASEAGFDENKAKEMVRAWAKTCPAKYQEREFETRWKDFRKTGENAQRLGTLFKRARECGWVPPTPDFEIVKDSILANQRNVLTALAALDVVVRYDVFADRAIFARGDAKPEPLQDHHVSGLRLEIDRDHRWFLANKDLFYDTVVDLAHRNSFHPVRDYLDSLTWDGKPRLDRWLIDYAGAEDSDFVRAVSPLPLLAAVRRVRRPGAKFDEMLILEGPQGVGEKSSAIAALCPDPDWFSDDLPCGADAKVVIERTVGKWLIEAGELAGMSKTDVRKMKAFLSREKDEARLSYGRIKHSRERQFVLIGTTNDDEYLRDWTGNRRYWPVRIAKFDLDRLRADRDQLWAEAAAREAAGESIRLAREWWGVAAGEQEGRRVHNPWEGRLSMQLGEDLESSALDGKILIEDVWDLVGMHDPKDRTQTDLDLLSKAMTRLGFKRRQLRLRGVGPVYWYVRPPDAKKPERIVVDLDPDARSGLRPRRARARLESEPKTNWNEDDDVPF